MTFRKNTSDFLETNNRLSCLIRSMATNLLCAARIGMSKCDAIAQWWCKWKRSILILVICFLLCFCFLYFFVFSHRLSASAPYALGCWQFPVFSFTTQIWYDKWRKHGVSITTHLSANKSAHTKFNFFIMSHWGGYADIFVLTVGIRVSDCLSYFWSFAISAQWGVTGYILL